PWVPKLIAGHRRRLRQHGQFQRLPTAAERDPAGDPGLEEGDPGEPRQLGADREGLRVQGAGGGSPDDGRAVALAGRVRDLPIRGVDVPPLALAVLGAAGRHLAPDPVPAPALRGPRPRVRHGRPDPAHGRPGLEPARLEPRLDEPRAGPAPPRPRPVGRVGADVPVCAHLPRRRRPDRLSRRLLRREARDAHEDPAADPARAAVLDQLLDADARLDQPALAGRLWAPVPGRHGHQQPAVPRRHHLRPEQLPQRSELHRDPGADLRLHPVLHPPALRLAGPHRPIPAGSGPRPRREPVPDVLARHIAAVEDRPSRRRGTDHAADVRRLLHDEHRVRRAVNVDDRQPDRPVLPRRPAADDRGRDHGPARPLPDGPDDLLHADRPPRLEGDPGVSQAVARAPARESEFGRVQRLRRRLGNQWGKPRFLVLITWGYIAWAIVPVLVAIQFSFNDGRSLSVWHGFTLKWYTSTDP